MSLRKMDLLILWQEKAVLWRRRIWSYQGGEFKEGRIIFGESSRLSRTCGLTKDDLIDMIKIIGKDE